MRHLVPFVSEQKVVRADDEQARAKRSDGKAIDAVVSDDKAESSWDDVVPEGWQDKSKPKPLTPATARPSASISMPRPQVPMKANQKLNAYAKKIAPAGSSAPLVTFSDSPSMNWVRINNGLGLRVSIYGSIDSSLRKEWSRLLNDPESADVKEFEFNLSETPTLSLTGLGMLLLFKERKGSVREAIKLCNCNKDVTQLLNWTGMEKYFAIESTQILPPK